MTVNAIPLITEVTSVGGTKTANGDNTLIAAPAAGLRIVLVDLTLQNESSTASSGQLTDGASGTVLERVFGQNQGDGVSKVYPSNARKKLTAATALILNLSSGVLWGYTVGYYTEAS